MRAYLAESRADAERWSTAVQCLLRGVNVSADTGECTVPLVLQVCLHTYSSNCEAYCVGV